ncbi:MAG: PEP-CTERM sorting domain-containing protein [Deltaproteobacteria bacterium]|nr:PEP-CTERM sorting domain-containing protein [Deltaproteobacteria bacterium]
MKKIIGAIFLGAFLCAGTAFAGSMPAGQGDRMHPLMDDEKGFFASAAIDNFANDGEGDRMHPLLDDENGFFASAANDIFEEGATDDRPDQGFHHGEQHHEPSAVPVPGTVLLLGSGVAGLFFMRRNNHKA